MNFGWRNRAGGFALPKPAGMQQFRPVARRPDRARSGERAMKTMLRATVVCLVFAGSAFALTGERFPEMPLDKMTPAQRTVADSIMSGPRKGMNGPFNAWLR